jgi:hypothetical protein
MQVTIIPSDNFIAVDGYGIGGIDMSGVASDVHAVQFKNGAGHVEIVDGDNIPISSITPYQTIIDRHAAAKYEIEQRAINPFYGMTPEEAISAATQNKSAQLQAEFATRMEEPLLYDGDTFLVDAWSIQTIKTTLDTCMYMGLTGTDPVPTRAPLQPGYWLAADTDGEARIPVPMTVARLQGLHIAGWERNTDLWGALIVHRTTIEAMVAEDATAEQIMAYDHTQGW